MEISENDLWILSYYRESELAGGLVMIKAKGIFSEDGRAQIWISNDADHLLLQMTSHLKFGSLSLHLKSRKLLDTAGEADSSHRGDHRALNNGRPPER